MKIKRFYKIIASLLSSVLIINTIPFTTYAENRQTLPQDSGSIISFAALDGSVAEQTVAYGTELTELDLPSTLTATVRLSSDTPPTAEGPDSPETGGKQNGTEEESEETGDVTEPKDDSEVTDNETDPKEESVPGEETGPKEEFNPEEETKPEGKTESEGKTEPEGKAEPQSKSEQEGKTEQESKSEQESKAKSENETEPAGNSETDPLAMLFSVPLSLFYLLPSIEVHAAELEDGNLENGESETNIKTNNITNIETNNITNIETNNETNIKTNSETKIKQDIPVEWTSTPAYNGKEPGTYTFTATVTDPGFLLLADPPKITVTVTDADSTAHITFTALVTEEVWDDLLGRNVKNQEEKPLDEAPLYLNTGIPVTDEILLADVAAQDETGEAVTVTVSSTDDLDLEDPQLRMGDEGPEPYILTYTATHPATGEIFTATRDCFVTAGIMKLGLFSDYAALQADCANANGDTTVTLSGDILNGDTQLTIGRNLTLDLNGHTLTIDVNNGVNNKENGIKINSGKKLTITDSSGGKTGKLNVTNHLEAPEDGAGAGINTTDATLIIENGTVTATGGVGGAGIGGGNLGAGGTVTIGGGTVTATGGGGSAGYGGSTTGAGAGIGGGRYGDNGGTITIGGGTVTAIGGRSSAGIGGGAGTGEGEDRGNGGTIKITGGTVIATGSDGAAGIGGGVNGRGDIIEISGGKVKATGVKGGAGIGGGHKGVSGQITISGSSEVEATGGLNSAGIGGGAYAAGGQITISGDTVTATGNGGGAGIGGGSGGDSGTINITGGSVTAKSSGTGGAGIGGGEEGAGTAITISGSAEVTATGGMDGAGIGSGVSGTTGGTINISSGKVIATGTQYGAGIGGGYHSAGGEITIGGGTVTATGGDDYAAGIGGGFMGDGGTVAINGGTVTAIGKRGGAGIGSGYGGNNGGSLDMNGNGVVIASSVSDNDAKEKGILFVGDTGTVYGYVTLAEDLEIPVGKTLHIPEGAKLTIPEDITLTNYGTIENVGGIINNGEIFDGGTIAGNGEITGGGDASSRIDLADPTKTSGDGWIYNPAGMQFIINNGANVIITGKAPDGTSVWINPNAKANITLNSVAIKGDDSLSRSAFILESGAEVSLTLVGDNFLTGDDSAGLHSKSDTTLVITAESTGSLTATGTGSGAGIGGSGGGGGTITIGGGTVTAIATGNGAGIGGSGISGGGGTITISGGTVTATGNNGGAGIGGGYHGAGGNITISAGKVTATGGNGGAGIGGGSGSGGGTITISGGTITAIASGNDSAGIGDGNSGVGGNITISDGKVTATGGSGGAGIGGASGKVTIDGGTVIATGNSGGAGIGSSRTKDGGTINIGGSADITATSSGDDGAGIGGGSGGAGGDITISGDADVKVTGGKYSAGIGGGNGGTGGNITISGSVDITATGGYDGAGIGGGYNGAGGDITINGGTVTANGGELGAGIGGGCNGAGGQVDINGGTVTATGGTSSLGIGGTNSAGIGGGASSNDGGTLDMDGDGVVFASSVSDIGDKTKGILFNGNSGTVYDSVTLADDLEIKDGKTLNIPGTAVFTIDTGVTLTITTTGGMVNDGTITNKGTIIITGEMVNDGTITNNGTIINNGTASGNGTLTNNGTVSKATQKALTLNIGETGPYTYAPGKTLTLSATGGSGSGVTIYNLVSGPGLISNGQLTITGAGEIKVTVTKAGDDFYDSITSSPHTITVNKADQTTAPAISGGDISKQYGMDPFSLSFSGGGESTGKYSFTSSNTGIATVDENGLVTLGTGGNAIGSTHITVKRLGDDNYNDTADSVAITLTVSKADGSGAPNMSGSYTGNGEYFTYTIQTPYSTSTVKYEYKMGLYGSWQDSNVFSGIDLNAHTFYAREKETSTHLAGVAGTNSVNFQKLSNVSLPDQPTMANRAATSITLTAIAGAEYSRDKTVWQDSVLFEGLTPHTGYTFYARFKATNTHVESNPSEASDTMTTEKAALAGSPPVIDKTAPEYGDTLTVNTSGLYADPPGDSQGGRTAMGTLSYQWNRSGTPIPDTNSPTYTLVAADIGEKIAVTVTAQNCQSPITSFDTAAVVPKTITQAMITAAAQNKPYDDNKNAAVTGVFTTGTILTGDTVTVTLTGTFDTANAGTGKTVTITNVLLGGTHSSRYRLASNVPTDFTASADIVKKTVTVKADDKTAKTGETLPAPTVSYTGFVGTDDEDNALEEQAVAEHTATDTSTAGTFDITFATQAVLNAGTSANYTLDHQEGKLVVTKPVPPAGSGSSSSGGGNSDTSSNTIPSAPAGKQPNIPTPAKSNATGTVTDGVLSVIITDRMAKDALASVTDKRNGVAVQFQVAGTDSTGGTDSSNNVDAAGGTGSSNTGDTAGGTGSTAGHISLTATFERAALERLKAAGVKYVRSGSALIDITLDLNAVETTLAQTTGNVTVSAVTYHNPTGTAKTLTGTTKTLTGTAKTLIGTRPVFDITVKGENGMTVSDLQGGTAAISIPYTPAPTEQTGNLYGVYLPANNKPQLITGSGYIDGKVIIRTEHLSVYGVGYKTPATAFTDTADHWAKDDIDFAVSRGLINGISTSGLASGTPGTSAAGSASGTLGTSASGSTSGIPDSSAAGGVSGIPSSSAAGQTPDTQNTLFSPDTAIIRADFIMALGKLSGADMSSFKQSSFGDVPNNSPYMPYMEWALASGIINNANGTGTVITGNPDAAVTREEMAFMLIGYARTTGYVYPAVQRAVTFTDAAAIHASAKAAVTTMQQAGIMTGRGNQFAPKAAVTRAEAAEFLHRYVLLSLNGS